jgi:transposase
MKTKNIYPKRNINLRKIFEEFSPDQLLYVPIDVAKYNHTSCIINFFGDILVPAFEFPNNTHGVDFLTSKIKEAVKRSGAKKIFIGLEATGHYHHNLTLRLKSLGLDVLVINPFDAWKERLYRHSKTDKIDLKSIFKALSSQKFSLSSVPEGVYYSLQRATRTRRKFVSRKTSSQNAITALMDCLFPGLWDKDNSIFSDKWGKGSLLLIERYPTPQMVLRLGEERLLRFFRKNNTKLTLKTVRKIIAAAKAALTRDPQDQLVDILALRCHIKTYKLYKEIIAELENEIAHLLVQTPGTYLLSVPGISVTLAAEITAEIGDINRFAYAKQIISLAGTCSKKEQTGEYDSQGLPMSKKGNKFLRTSLNQAGLSLNAWCEDFHSYYARKAIEKAERKGIARTATGNKFAKLAFALMKHEQLYLPRTLRTTTSDLKQYYLDTYANILGKLAQFSSKQILPKDNYLEKIQKKLEKQYGLDLSRFYLAA